MNRATTFLASLALTCSVAAAQTAPATAPATAPRAPDVHKLTVHAQAPADPALRYRLTIPFEEQTAGNGAPVYLSAMMAITSHGKGFEEQLVAHHDQPVDELPRDEVRALLAKGRSMLDQVHVAARRDHCDWDMPRREHGAMALLPHLNRARPLAYLLSLQTRLAVAEGRYDDASESLATSLKFARDLQAGGMLLDGLVSAMVANLLLDDVEAFMSRSDAPNLYWPLASVPRPFVDVAEVIRRERGFLYEMFPALRDVRNIGETEWRAILIELGRGMVEDEPTEEELARLDKEIVEMNAAMLPLAREHLKREGMTPEQVEAMPPHRAVAIFTLAEYRQWADAMTKWYALPTWEAYSGIRQTAADLKASGAPTRNALVATSWFAGNVGVRIVAADRKLAALQTLEAVRAHAAAHGGTPPAELSDVAVPVPVDPLTGEPFRYEADGKRVTLTGPAPGDDPRESLAYEVTIQ